MRIATISSKKLADAGEGTVKNNYLYNDKELFDDGDLNWYDYGFRNYDPQIGRFTQLDPLTFEFSFLTPYQYASDDPIGNIDIDGLEGSSALNTVASGVKDFTYAYDVGSKISMEFIQVTHVVTGGASAVAKASTFLKVGELLGMAVKAGQIINNFSKTRGVGNVSESTNPYRPGQLAAIRSGAYLTPEQKPWEPPVLSACTHCGNMPEISNDQKTDPYVSIIRKETVEKLSNSPSDELFAFIGLRNLVVAGRMELGGFHKEAMSSLKKVPGEMSLMALPIGSIADETFQAIKGISVIGPRSIYREFAQKISANFLNITDDAWTWAKNEKFLSGIVKRGDDVIFAGRFDPNLFDKTSVLAREIKYLESHGYQWTNDFTKMILKK